MPSGYSVTLNQQQIGDLDNIFSPKLQSSVKAADVGFNFEGLDISNRYEPIKLGELGKLSYNTNFQKSGIDLRYIFQAKGTFSATLEVAIFKGTEDTWGFQGRIYNTSTPGYKYKVSTDGTNGEGPNDKWNQMFITKVEANNDIFVVQPEKRKEGNLLTYLTNVRRDTDCKIGLFGRTGRPNITINTIDVYTMAGVDTGLKFDYSRNYRVGTGTNAAPQKSMNQWFTQQTPHKNITQVTTPASGVYSPLTSFTSTREIMDGKYVSGPYVSLPFNWILHKITLGI